MKRQLLFRLLPGLLALSLPLHAALAAAPSPYAGQETRAVKALSPEDMDDLMNGRGMGLAKAGELNGYPGPAHLLDLASELKLTADQLGQIRLLMEGMTAHAKPLGLEIIRRERELEQQFETGSITEAQLASETEAIGNLQGRLRAVHLAAHIEAKRLLTPEQIAGYNKLRGYASASTGMTHPGMPMMQHPGMPAHHGMNPDAAH